MAACGLFLLNKDQGLTSQTAVNRVKRLFGEAKAGHTGTLDPMAEGVLPILLGRAVKASEFLLHGDKHYEAVLRLGVTSDTEDVWGNLTETGAPLPDGETVLGLLPSFTGEILQTPPMYSALKVGGQKLCDLARKGVEIAREARPVTVYSLEGQRLTDSDYRLTVRCSGGTYIRTLCADIGKALGTGGVMARLTRASAARFSIERAVTLADLEKMTEEERRATLIPLDALFPTFPKVTLPPFFARLARSGAPIYQKKIGTAFPLGERVAFYDAEGFFGLAESATDADGAPVLRSLRLFFPA